MKQADEAAKVVRHEMTATVQLEPRCDQVDHKSGMFGGEYGWSWSIIPQPARKVHLAFWARDGNEAIMTAHKLMQKHARGKADASNYRKKRAKYGPTDYRIIELRHAGTGAYTLPGGANPDLSPQPRKSNKEQTGTFSFMEAAGAQS